MKTYKIHSDWSGNYITQAKNIASALKKAEKYLAKDPEEKKFGKIISIKEEAIDLIN